jgi:hypothetical protein
MGNFLLEFRWSETVRSSVSRDEIVWEVELLEEPSDPDRSGRVEEVQRDVRVGHVVLAEEDWGTAHKDRLVYICAWL